VIAVEPVERLGERAAGHVHAMEPSVALADDEPGLLQHAHVARDRGRGHFQRLAQLADARGTAREALDHVAPGGVGERREHGVERVELMVNHVVNY
jgi:hypothetical protein